MSNKFQTGNKKGFIRVIEIVIFSFMLFAILLPEFFWYSDPNEWSEVKNSLLARDLLASLEKTDILEEVLMTDPINDGSNLIAEKEEDLAILENITAEIFPVTSNFEYEIKNVGPPLVSIGCMVCSEEDETWLKESILTPSYPTIEFSIKSINYSEMSDSFDTYIIFGDWNLEAREEEIKEQLNEGKGFILINDFSTEPDDFTKELFDIDWSLGSSGTRDIQFSNLSDALVAGISKRFSSSLIRIPTTGSGKTGSIRVNGQSYSVRHDLDKDCLNISDCSECLEEDESCTFPDGAKITLFQIDPLYGDWFDAKLSNGGTNSRDYVFRDSVPLRVDECDSTLLTDGSHSLATARITEYGTSYETAPRLLWMYDFDRSNDDLSLLFKSGIIWSSGEHFFLFRKEIPDDRIVATHFYTGLGDNGIPYTIKLYTWGY